LPLPTPNQNSIGQIVEHLIASKEWQIEMLEHGQAPAPVWIEPAGDEADWQAARSRLAEAHQRLKQTLARLTDAELLQVPDAGGRAYVAGVDPFLRDGPRSASRRED